MLWSEEMTTTGKTASELFELVREELRNYDECNGVRVAEVYPLPNADPNWSAHWDEYGTSVSSDCKRAFIAAVVRLQRQFHLLTDD